MNRTTGTWALCILFSAACGDDIPDGVFGASTGLAEATSGGTTSPTSDDSGDAADETGEGGGEGGGELLPCTIDEEIGTYDFVDLPTTPTDITVVDDCNFGGIVGSQGFSGTEEFDIWVYHPQDSLGDWPADHPPFPVAFFAPGVFLQIESGGDHYYEAMMEALARAGFVVVAVEPQSVGWGITLRRAALACAMIWAREDTTVSSHIGDVMAIVGHSRGGSAVTSLTADILAQTNLPSGTALDEWEQRAAISIAPGYNAMFDTDVDITDSTSPPHLYLHGGVDQDVEGTAITAFDNRYSEVLAASNDELELHDEVLLWAHDFFHGTWGGVSLGVDEVVAPFYVPEFLRWQMLAEVERRESFVDIEAWDVDAQSFPTSVASDARWTSTELELFYDGCSGAACPTGQSELSGVQRPLIAAGYTQGLAWEGADRLVVDNLERTATGFQCEDFQSPNTDVGTSTLGGLVTATADVDSGEADPCVCQGDVSALMGGVGDTSLTCDLFLPDGLGSFTRNAFANGAFASHDTEALLVQWGGGFGGASVSWGLEFGDLPIAANDIADSTHLSFRIANVRTDHDRSCDDPLDEVNIRVELRHDDLPLEASGPIIEIGPGVDPHARELAGQGGTACRAHQFMHTVRIPLPDFCDQGGVSINELTEVVLHFDDCEPSDPGCIDEPHVALVDSLEFTHDPFAPGGSGNEGECAQRRAGWRCEATTTLDPQRASCDTEPTSGTCPVGYERSDDVDPPIVDDEPSDFDGWIVTTPEGWVVDPANPTSSELDFIADLCVQACQIEYAGQPAVSANCSDSGAFETPTLYIEPDIASVHWIADGNRYGNGLFAQSPLGVDLEVDACTEFDEALCAARLQRPTSASAPLERGEERRVALAGNSRVRFETASSTINVAMQGEAGYSLCTDGNGVACPFYIGSLAASNTETKTLTDTCPDSTQFSAEVSDFDIELVQPAFGVAEAGSDEKAFPKGSVHMRSLLTVNGDSYLIRAINAEPIYFEADNGGLFTGDMEVDLHLPCGVSTIAVTAAVKFESSAILEEPPSISITTSATAACDGSSVALTASVSDPDSDLYEVLWYVDDVLLGPSVTSIPVTQAHEIRAVAIDDRGAATTDTLSLGCS